MDKRGKLNHGELETPVIIPDVRSEIELDGSELLKLDLEQPRASVTCTAGTLWLTQQGDPQDYVLVAGQTFTLSQRGTVLVQGVPCGTARILSVAA